MKKIFENWNKFVNEKVKRLPVYSAKCTIMLRRPPGLGVSIDDTLARIRAVTYVTVVNSYTDREVEQKGGDIKVKLEFKYPAESPTLRWRILDKILEDLEAIKHVTILTSKEAINSSLIQVKS